MCMPCLEAQKWLKGSCAVCWYGLSFAQSEKDGVECKGKEERVRERLWVNLLKFHCGPISAFIFLFNPYSIFNLTDFLEAH